METRPLKKSTQVKEKSKRKLMNEFKRPYIYYNWCKIARLDGADLINGEKLEIQFEDGSVEIHKIKVDKSSYMEQDHSFTRTVPVTKAYFMLDYKGINMKVELSRKFKARRV